MEKLTIDIGIKEYQINDGGVLRFNPSDPNVYARLLDAMDDITAVEQDAQEKVKEIPKDDGAAVLRLMASADAEMKKILNRVFGTGNDFNEILNGVNVMAVCSNGERAITNLLNALMPIVKEGAERCAKQQAQTAVEEARLNRAQRRAAQ